MPLFRKKPVVIEAIQWTGANQLEITKWSNGHVQPHIPIEDNKPIRTHYLSINTLEGTMLADPGDWIIRGIKGEFYPCKPDIFEQTYESADA